MSSDQWKLENDLCRCCHAEGTFKNLAEPYNSLGQEEVYSDMLQECFNIDLTPVPGQLCAVTYTICEVCCSRLRDAANFKKQVLDCELRFKDMYAKNFVKSLDSKLETEIKVEIDSCSEDSKGEYSQMDEDEDDDLFEAKLIADDESKSDVEEDSPKKKAKKLKPKPKTKAKMPAKSTKPVKSNTLKKEGDAVEKEVDGEKKGYTNFVKTEPPYSLVENIDGIKEYVCSVCESAFKKLDYVQQHYRCVHLKLRKTAHACQLCPEKIPSHLRAKHMEMVHGVPAPTCGACGQKFSFPNQVLRHQKAVHMLEKNYSCGYCNMRFPTRTLLKQHTYKHSGERPYKCELCGKAFRWKKNLKTHIDMHLDERRHICPHCPSAFVQQSSLKYHISTRHPEML